jgi:CheY-like chemotaxis protein
MAKILVIDDNEAIRYSLEILLNAEEFEVVSAANGTVGIQLACKQHPDMILCDVLMPGMSGYEVLKTLQQTPATATIPFIFLTAMVDKNILQQSGSAQGSSYLIKPFTRDELLGIVTTQLSRNAG